MTLKLNDLTVQAIEVRPGEGVIVRLAKDADEMALRELSDGLHDALRSSPYAIFRTCCDSSPAGGHLGTCENSLMRGGKGV